MSTDIEWCDETINPVIGCQKLSAGCTNCYAVRMAHRLGANPKTPQYKGLTRNANTWTGETRLVENELRKPFGWKKPRTNSKSDARARASAMIAKIPLPLSRHIAAYWKPAAIQRERDET